MKQIKDNPNGWMPFVKEVQELVGRELTPTELAAAMQAYIKPISAQTFADKLDK